MDVVKLKQDGHEIAIKMMEVFNASVQYHASVKNAEEQVYLTGCILGVLNATIYIAMDSYSQTYGLKNFSGDVFKAWVNEIEKELVELNRNTVEGLPN